MTTEARLVSTRGYPLAAEIPAEQLDAEIARLNELSKKPVFLRLPGYFALGGPGFMGAAATLGAGTLTAAMLSGAQFGYRLLWIIWVAIGVGLFMMAAMARFTTHLQEPVIQVQRTHHGRVVSKAMTAFLGLVCVSIFFNFGQVALGTELVAGIAEEVGGNFPREWNWPLYGLLTAWIALNYGRSGGGVRFVENVMKAALLLMLLSFSVALVVVGIDWPAAIEGLFVPWLPRGAAGIDLFIASSAAAIGVMDWVFFQYAGLARGWGRKHEPLARFDMVMGLAVPYVLVSFVVVALFAGTIYGSTETPSTAVGLSRALVPLLGETGAALVFLVGFLAVPITTTVVMSIACAIGMHEMFDWEPDVRSVRWKACVLLPQIALLGAWLPNPVALIIVIAAFLSLTNNIVGWSFFLLLNDRRVMRKSAPRSYLWNVGILLQVTLLNCVALMWVFNRFGLWEA